ncbi:endoplasmic reticulum-Golgi intermediate compartment 3 [Chlorella sorokiniana]|uniref:Endoplasmic reticulum-Golgi intermediate compartment 3 n=1 Tax=Chlorella sorokiniana TaxID=3076 RepID=A0A2P6TIS7_CHLSO|nr:endoplasmic reticulum-Golgi intermediate compartment 3 [Chlorella sorokiniana]|eukprot:PRW39153.1 endoplasmic reticulum-Golgi intermediate compartment 3 [Chlorella sorokiniana]
MVQSRRWKLSQLTAFSHAQDHLKVQTASGGIVTLLGVCVALILFFSEAWQCLSVRRVQEMSVDVARGEDLHVTFNLTFPALPCEALLLDAGDVSGKWQTESKLAVARNGEVHKHSVDLYGNWLKLAEYTPPMGGEWDNPFVLRVDQQELTDISEAIKRHEGCNIYGWLQVARVAGNIHFAVRPEALFLSKNAEEIQEALRQRQVLLHGMGAELHPDASKLNMSHIVHTLRFGPHFPGQANPLEGSSEIDRKSTGIDKYFLKVVPTDYYTLWGRKTHTYQYSVTSYYQQFKGGEEMPPAVYLLYDTSPIRVELRDTRPGVLRLLVRVCAVVGGAFAVTGLLDKIIEGLLRDVRKAIAPRSHTHAH